MDAHVALRHCTVREHCPVIAQLPPVVASGLDALSGPYPNMTASQVYRGAARRIVSDRGYADSDDGR